VSLYFAAYSILDPAAEMAAIALLSHHSSNPLENHSSDSKNGFDPFPTLAQAACHGGMTSSEDPINGYSKPEVQQFHEQISTLFPGMLESAKTAKPKVQHMVNLEYDEMASEDELELSRTFRNEDDEEVEDETMFEDDYENDEEDEEEKSILQKSPEERQEIMDEIADLEEKVPLLSMDYQLIDRLGTGTFSSVYKAVDLGYHDKWDNSTWHGSHPPSSSAHYQSTPHSRGSKVFVAIKRIYVTSNPERIRNEISIMEDCRSCRHVSQLMTAFRKEDQVVAIMPYHRNEDFRVG
jgi:cell division control protein 7